MSRTLEKQLLYAVGPGDINAVKRALQDGANIHSDEDHALRSAAWNGHAEVVALLLKSGADIHVLDDYALRVAADKGHLDVVDLLLKSGADVHAHDDYALRWSVHRGHHEIVVLLLKAGADVHANSDVALHTAVTQGHHDIVPTLTHAGADFCTLYQNLPRRQILPIIKQHAATAYRGMELVMMLAAKSRMEVLRHLHPDLKPKQIRDEIAMMQAFGLNLAQMGEMWRDRHVAPKASQEMGVTP